MTDLCKVCGSTDIDDYGCIDCFMNTALTDWYDSDEDWSDGE